MKNLLFLAAGAAALSLASCQSETKTTDTTTNTVMPADATATAGTDMDAMYQARAQRISDKFYQDMKITDEAMKAKIRTAYYNRAKRMGEMKTKYTSDTTGMAAANREAMMATDTEFKGILTDPAQYQSYESSRATYDESNYMDDNAASSMSAPTEGSTGTDAMSSNADMNSGSNMSSTDAGTMSGSAVEKGKMKMADGSKMKIKDDGSVKTKDADGNKMK